jgi:hypothetical protein
MGCPVLTGEPVQGVHWITQAQLLPQMPGQQAMEFDARAKCYEILGKVAYGALQHAYETLGALQSCCEGQDSEFYQNALWQIRELINGMDGRL